MNGGVNLELKVPPPVVLAAVLGGMWLIARVSPHVAVAFAGGLGAFVMAAGVALNLGGVLAVRRAKATFNPLRPETTTALVSTGLFALSRNPMYLGMLVVLLGWAVYRRAPVTLIGPVAFVLYINRFQILPEERVLLSLFGASFEQYKGKVRRWV